MSDEYAYSYDEEIYNDKFNTREEAILEAIAVGDGGDEVFYIGKLNDALNYVSFDCGDLIIEHLACMMSDNLGHDICDDWLQGSEEKAVSQRIKEVVNPLVEKIIRELALPSFWGICDAEEMSENKWKEEIGAKDAV